MNPFPNAYQCFIGNHGIVTGGVVVTGMVVTGMAVTGMVVLDKAEMRVHRPEVPVPAPGSRARSSVVSSTHVNPGSI